MILSQKFYKVNLIVCFSVFCFFFAFIFIKFVAERFKTGGKPSPISGETMKDNLIDHENEKEDIDVENQD